MPILISIPVANLMHHPLVLVFIEESDIVRMTQNLKKNLPLGFDGTKCKTLLFDNFKS